MIWIWVKTVVRAIVHYVVIRNWRRRAAVLQFSQLILTKRYSNHWQNWPWCSEQLRRLHQLLQVTKRQSSGLGATATLKYPQGAWTSRTQSWKLHTTLRGIDVPSIRKIHVSFFFKNISISKRYFSALFIFKNIVDRYSRFYA